MSLTISSLTISVQNPCDSLDPHDQYKLKFDPEKPVQTAVAKVVEKGSEFFLSQDKIVWRGIEGLSEKKIRGLTFKFHLNFQVKITLGKSCEMTIFLRKRKSLLSFDSAHALSLELKNGLILNPDIADIISKMIAFFVLEIDFSHADEILSIFPHATLSGKKEVSQKFIGVALKNPSLWQERHIHVILDFLKSENHHLRYKKTSQDNCPLFRADESYHFLNSMFNKAINETLPSTYICTIIVFLEMLQASPAIYMYQSDFTRYYNALTELLEAKKDEETTFFLTYAEQALKGLHNPIEEAILQKWLEYDNHRTEPKEIVPFQPTLLPSQSGLFNRSLKEHIPWIMGLQLNKQELFPLETNNISTVATVKNADLLEQTISLLKNKKNKIIFIKGRAESGKSTFLKQLTHHYFNSYTTKKHAVPLFISISDIKNPVKGLIDEVLDKYGLASVRDKLLNVRTIWIIDGLHNLQYNLFQTNNFELWKNAQIVLSCRTENLADGYQQHLDPFCRIRCVELIRDVYFRELEIVPFSEEKKL